jgi:hypothetical protein
MRYTNSNQEIPEFAIKPDEALELLMVSSASLCGGVVDAFLETTMTALQTDMLVTWLSDFTGGQFP